MTVMPNVTLRAGRRGRLAVLVDGNKMAGVRSVEIVREMQQRTGPDGWTTVEPTGQTEVVIRVLPQFVKFESEE
jgi:hypothetical protein